MNFKKEYIRFSGHEILNYFLFMFLYLFIIAGLISLVFGNSGLFHPEGLALIFIVVVLTLIPFYYNKKGVLTITGFENKDEILTVINEGLNRHGLIEKGMEDSAVLYDKKTKLGRLFSFCLLDKVKIVTGLNEVKVYSLKRILNAVEYEVRRKKGLLPSN